MSLLNGIVKAFLKQRKERISYAVQHPFEIQEKTILQHIWKARNTEWGRNHGFSSTDSIKKFTERVPVQDYESLKPFIERMRNGEQHLLWHTPVYWFAKSSGTTEDRSKFIPVSRESLAYTHYRAGKDVLAFYVLNNPKTKIFNGKCLVLTGSTTPHEFNQRSFSGDISGVLIENMSQWIHWFRTPAKEIAIKSDWEEKIELIIRATSKTNVTYLSGVPSWMMILLQKMLEYSGKKDIKEIWPQLELFIHGAVNFQPYRNSFDQLLSSLPMNYYETYNASEGFFSMQDSNQPGEMLLMMDYGIFYEFIPMEEIHLPNPRTLTIQEVEADTHYAMLISTNAGLWRYRIGDTIKFTSLQPFRIQITGRTKHFINAFGEELVIENSDRAIAEACLKTRAILKEYTVAPIYLRVGQPGAHEWLIEFEKEPDNREDFIRILDQTLMSVNSDYDAKRKGDLTLGEPKVRFVPPKTFYDWLKSRGKLGGQHKVPRLYNNRQYVDDILRQINIIH
jgi:hypothetical protein